MIFRKKPVEIEARRYIGVPTEPDNQPHYPFDAYAEELRLWLGAHGQQLEPSGCWGDETAAGRKWEILIPTLEGTMAAVPGDYIIQGVKGEFYPCKPDIFDATYEQVA